MRIIDEGIYVFDKEGVLVRIHPEMMDVIPRQLPLEWHRDMWQGDLKPLRLVIHLEIVGRNNREQYPIDINFPIQFQVYYTSYEKSAGMKQRNPNSLAYWRNEQWKLITGVEDIYPVLCCGWAGFLRFKIKTWGDPTIGLFE
jgi:hypothetical protein